jgi:hypothetical protein
MKPLLILTLSFFFLSATCQERENSYIPAGILIGTFSVIEFNGQNMTQSQCQKIAITGFITSIGSHYAIRAINKNLKSRRFKRIN